jgi:hypothetical protein
MEALAIELLLVKNYMHDNGKFDTFCKAQYFPITSSWGHLDDVLLPDWTSTQQSCDITC